MTPLRTVVSEVSRILHGPSDTEDPDRVLHPWDCRRPAVLVLLAQIWRRTVLPVAKLRHVCWRSHFERDTPCPHSTGFEAFPGGLYEDWHHAGDSRSHPGLEVSGSQFPRLQAALSYSGTLLESRNRPVIDKRWRCWLTCRSRFRYGSIVSGPTRDYDRCPRRPGAAVRQCMTALRLHELTICKSGPRS